MKSDQPQACRGLTPVQLRTRPRQILAADSLARFAYWPALAHRYAVSQARRDCLTMPLASTARESGYELGTRPNWAASIKLPCASRERRGGTAQLPADQLDPPRLGHHLVRSAAPWLLVARSGHANVAGEQQLATHPSLIREGGLYGEPAVRLVGAPDCS
jgi:hypothetical protein